MINYTKVIIYSLITLIVFIFWSVFYKLDQGLIFYGKLLNEDETLYVDSTVNAVINQVFIKEGDYVKLDDLLIKMTNPNDIDEHLHLEYKLENLRLEKQNLDSATIYFDKLKKNLEIKIDSFKELESEGFIKDTFYIEHKNKLNEANYNFQLNKNKLIDIDLKVSELEHELKKLSNEKEALIIKSNFNGIIKKIFYKNVGQFVNKGDHLIEMISDEKNKIIQANINPNKRNKINLNQNVKVLFESEQDSIKDNYFKGKISFISPDSFKENHSNLEFFKINITLDELPEISIGSSCTIVAQSSDETFFDYLFNPIKQRLKTNFKEEIS